jgi:hypothetical protein
MNSENMLVIIPSIRNPDVIDLYSKNAVEHGFDTNKLFFMIITEDSADKQEFKNRLVKNRIDGLVVGEKERNSFMNSWNLSEFIELIPKRSHAETSFGLVYMHRNDFMYGILIDDDTSPLATQDFFGTHLRNLKYNGKMRSLASSTGWVNVLHSCFHKYKLYPRGFPYGAMGEKNFSSYEQVNNVVLVQGLWTNIPDLDAVRILMQGDLNGQSKVRLNPDDYDQDFTVSRGNFTTICSMNLSFKRDILPAFYQFKMDDNPWGVGRFDDIWSGVVLKKAIDPLGYSIINGNPLCQHDKAPRSTFKDLKSEVAGLEANEIFYKEVDSAEVSSNDIYENTEAISSRLCLSPHPFINYCGHHLERWLDLLRKAS